LLVLAALACTPKVQAQEATATAVAAPTAPTPRTAGASGAASPAPAAPATEYRIGRGDELDLRFFYTPELNTRATVRSDGRISVPLIGELVVEGNTVAELGALVQRLLEPQVRRAQVAINVLGSSTMRVFVGGEVGKPGMQPLSGPMTALQAVMVAEGMKDTAQPSMAMVLRRLAQGGHRVLPLDLHGAMSGKDPAADVTLEPFDIVIVPRSGIADVGRWVDLYIRRTLPISFGFNYTIDRTGSATR
jgi:protein involved in polysaccharide export with SLBB domain